MLLKLIPSYAWTAGKEDCQTRFSFGGVPLLFSVVEMTRDPVQAQILAEELLTLLQKNAITKVGPNEQLAGFYSTYFLVL